MTMRFSGDALRAARKDKNLNQRELAQATGIPLDTLREYERDKYAPSALRLALLASTLGVSIDAFYAGDLEAGEEGRPDDDH
ncbi:MULTISPECIES: helix-turn-helix transcriptional regulator [unclassified Nonomuraea]|uniref:helix-turn-helix domain-containing protein n=1 Tax=unclassified Nonomuraea TaxID=2593643 RepID=UPI0033FFD683